MQNICQISHADQSAAATPNRRFQKGLFCFFKVKTYLFFVVFVSFFTQCDAMAQLWLKVLEFIDNLTAERSKHVLLDMATETKHLLRASKQTAVVLGCDKAKIVEWELKKHIFVNSFESH